MQVLFNWVNFTLASTLSSCGGGISPLKRASKFHDSRPVVSLTSLLRLGLRSASLRCRFPDSSCARISRYTKRTCRLTVCRHPSDVSWGVEMIKLFIKQSAPRPWISLSHVQVLSSEHCSQTSCICVVSLRRSTLSHSVKEMGKLQFCENFF